jgi:hypothetical protein
MVSMRRPDIWTGLIGFDMLRARRSCELVLARWQDRLVVVLMALFVGAAVSSALDRAPGPAVHPLWAALAALGLGVAVGAAHERRLEALARRSIAAPLALSHAARAAHLAAFSTLLLILSLLAARAAALGGLFVWPGIALILLGWGAGTLIGAAGAALWRGRRPFPAPPRREPLSGRPARSDGLLAIILRIQLRLGAPQLALLAAFALGSMQATAACLWTRALNPFAGNAAAAAIGLAAIFATARVSAGLCRFGAFAGVPAAHALAAHLAAPIAATLGAFLAAFAFGSTASGLAWLELGCGLVVIFTVAFRVLHYRIDPKSRADRLMQVELVVLVVAAVGLPPLASLLVAFRAVALYRADRLALWAIP